MRTYLVYGLILFFTGPLGASFAHAQATTSSDKNSNEHVNFDSLARACQTEAVRDKICEIIVNARDISNDAVEAVKQYVNLTPFEYAVLTTANAVANKRFRVRFRNPYTRRKVNQTLDIRKDSTMLYAEVDF